MPRAVLLVPALATAQQILEKKEKAAESGGKGGQARREARGQGRPIATVNGVAVPQARADFLMQQQAQRGAPDNEQMRGAVREELINREVLAQEAQRSRRREALPRCRPSSTWCARRSWCSYYLREFARKNPVTEAEIQKEYDRAKAQHGDKEYKARHILVETEDQAKGLIADLKKGAKFDELATKNSKDTGSAQRGGDLDWNVPATFDKQFSDAMVKLEKGKYSEAPVKTRFGFHIIQLDDVRPAKFAALGEVRPRIQQMLVQNKIDELIKGLRAKAKIE